MGGDAARVGLAVGVDVGGTKVAAGLVGADGSVVERRRYATPADDPVALVELLGTIAEELTPPGTALPVGVGIAALVDRAGVARYGPNLALVDVPLRAHLEQRLGVRVAVDNDANVAAWGEFRVGAGRDAPTAMVMLTLGTGVGGGVVLDGRLIRGGFGFGGELGHIIVARGGPMGPSGIRGELEVFASGTAIGETAERFVAEGRVPDGSILRQQVEITGKTVTTAAHAGDPAAIAVLAEVGGWLGVGIASLVNALDPEIVVVGGGAIQAGELLLGPARATLREHLVGAAHRPEPPIVRAALADDAGVVGAALLALEDVDPPPPPPAPVPGTAVAPAAR